jgi:hypothetical protein
VLWAWYLCPLWLNFNNNIVLLWKYHSKRTVSVVVFLHRPRKVESGRNEELRWCLKWWGVVWCLCLFGFSEACCKGHSKWTFEEEQKKYNSFLCCNGLNCLQFQGRR